MKSVAYSLKIVTVVFKVFTFLSENHNLFQKDSPTVDLLLQSNLENPALLALSLCWITDFAEQLINAILYICNYSTL